MQQTPPKLFLRFFKWFCDPKLHKHIEGDLLELYSERVSQSGKRKADVRFALDVFLLFRPGIIGRKKTVPPNHFTMMRYNLKIALRSLWKNKPSTFINVFGLTTGITSCLLIALFIQHEVSFDAFQRNGNRIARVIMEYKMDGSPDKMKGDFTSSKVAPVFSRTFPEVEKAVRMSDPTTIVKKDEMMNSETKFLYVDSSFFDMFHAEMLEGNSEEALDGINKVVLTASTAKRYFGEESPLGKILLIGSDQQQYEITGVMKDYPSISQFQFDFLASFSSLHANQEQTWYWANYNTYLLLKDEQSLVTLQEKLHPFMENEMKGKGSQIWFYLEQFNKVHLYSPHQALVPNTSITYLYILGGIAGLIIVIVCFTYINLSTARSVERAREVGIRKVSGAVKTQLFRQFIGESFVLCFLSVGISFSLAWILLPQFNLLTQKTFSVHELFTPVIVLFSFGTVVIVSLLAGAYPALVLSGLQPIKVLKGVFKNTSSAKWMQQSLIVFQFTITIFLIIATIVIQSQLSFIQNANLGYDRSHVLSITLDDMQMPYEKVLTLKEELKRNKDVEAVSRTQNAPVRIASGYTMRSLASDKTETLPVNANPIDEEYVAVNGFEFVAGRSFTEAEMKDAARDGEGNCYYILNESAAGKLGWTAEEAIGQKLQLNEEGVVRGVVKDFHFASMHTAIKPLVLFSGAWGHKLVVKVSGKNTSETISHIEKTWKTLIPDQPFEYHFLDDDYAALYKTETQLGSILNRFAVIAIILACLGLFGLSSYAIQQRMKEIGIRKVLGASVLSLLKVLSGNFVVLIVLAIFIATPLAYWVMSQWLNKFVYRTDLSIWFFAGASMLTIIIALTTISIHALRAVGVNPVKALRSE